jgi:hypothetical protein
MPSITTKSIGLAFPIILFSLAMDLALATCGTDGELVRRAGYGRKQPSLVFWSPVL